MYMNQIIYDSRCIGRVREKEIDISRLTSRQTDNHRFIHLPTMLSCYCLLEAHESQLRECTKLNWSIFITLRNTYWSIWEAEPIMPLSLYAEDSGFYKIAEHNPEEGSQYIEFLQGFSPRCQTWVLTTAAFSHELLWPWGEIRWNTYFASQVAFGYTVYHSYKNQKGYRLFLSIWILEKESRGLCGRGH